MKKLSLFLLLVAFSFFAKAQTNNPILNQDLAKISAHADTLFAHQQYELAYQNYNHLIQFEPQNNKAYRRMGYILSLSDNPTSWQQIEAIKMFKKAIEIDPNDRVSYYQMGLVYMLLAKHDKAIKADTQNKALAGVYLKKALDLGIEDANAAIKDLNGF